MSFRNILKRAAKAFFSDKPTEEPARAGIYRPENQLAAPTRKTGNRRQRRSRATFLRTHRKVARATCVDLQGRPSCGHCGDTRRIKGECLSCRRALRAAKVLGGEQ